MAGYGMTYELKFPGDADWTDISALVDTRKTQNSFTAFGTDLKAAIDVTSITLMYGANPKKTLAFHSLIFQRLLEAKNAHERVLFRMLHGTEARFTGHVDPGNLGQSAGSIPEKITLEIEDNAYLLRENIHSSYALPAGDIADENGTVNPGIIIFNPTDPVSSLVVQLILDAGYSPNDIDYNASDAVYADDETSPVLARIPKFIYDVDEKKTYMERIDIMLMEYRSVMDTTPEGKFYIRRTYYKEGDPYRDLSGYLLADKIQYQANDAQNDGSAVTWSSLAYGKGVTVYRGVSQRYNSDGTLADGDEVAPNGYWPTTGDIEEVWFEFTAKFLDRPYYTGTSRLQNKDLNLIATQDHEVQSIMDDDLSEVTEQRDIQPLKGKLLYHNANASTVRYVRAYSIIANALYRSKINEYTVPETAKNPADAYESEFIYDETSATNLASHMHQMQNSHGDMSYSWTSDYEIEPLELIKVAVAGTSVSTLVRVRKVTKTYPAPGRIRCKAEAIGVVPFNAYPPKKLSIQNGAGVQDGQPGTDGKSAGQFFPEFALSPSEFYQPTENALWAFGDALMAWGDALMVFKPWGKDVPTPTEERSITWARYGQTVPPATYPDYWDPYFVSRPAGIQDLRLYADQEMIIITSRGALVTGAIDITIVTSNLPINRLQISATDGDVIPYPISETENDPYRYILDCATVAGESTMVTASIVWAGQTISRTLTFKKQREAEPIPTYLGALSSIPEAADDGPLIIGDYFLYVGNYIGSNPEHDPTVEENTDARDIEVAASLSGEYIKGRLYAVSSFNADGSAVWTESRKSEHASAAYQDCLKIAQETNTWMYASVVVAQLGMYQDLITSYLSSPEVERDPDDPNRLTKGFFLDGPNGVINAYKIFAWAMTAYGTFVSKGFATINESTNTGVITPQSFVPRLWKMSEAIAAMPGSWGENILSVTGSINGKAIDTIAKTPGTVVWRSGSGSGRKASNGFLTVGSFSAGVGGFRMSGVLRTSGQFLWGNAHARILVNGNVVFGPTGQTNGDFWFDNIYLNRGDSVEFQIEGYDALGIWYGYGNLDYEYRLYTTGARGLFVRYTDNTWEIKPEKTLHQNTTQYIINGWSSDSLPRYVNGTDFYMIFSMMEVNDDRFASGSININGNPKTATRIRKNDGNISVYDGSLYAYIEKSNSATEGGVYSSLSVLETITLDPIESGIEVKHVLPWNHETDKYTVGSKLARFLEGFFKTINSETSISESAISDGSVTANRSNATGKGFVLSDDGDIVDMNNGYCAMRFSEGVAIYSAKSGGSPVIWLKKNGDIEYSGHFLPTTSPTTGGATIGTGAYTLPRGIYLVSISYTVSDDDGSHTMYQKYNDTFITDGTIPLYGSKSNSYLSWRKF